MRGRKTGIKVAEGGLSFGRRIAELGGFTEHSLLGSRIVRTAKEGILSDGTNEGAQLVGSGDDLIVGGGEGRAVEGDRRSRPCGRAGDAVTSNRVTHKGATR